MKKILEFLRSVPAFYVATVDEDNQPRVRPFSLVYEWEGKLSLGINDEKKVYRQLKRNPWVEISAFQPETGTWIRISAEVKMFKSTEVNRYILNEVMPSLKDVYGDEKNPSLVSVSLEAGQADFYSFASTEPIQTLKF